MNYLEALGEAVVKINKENGWHIPTMEDWKKEWIITAKLGLVVTEVAEAIEAFRHDDIDNFAEELGDITIRVLELATGMDIDLQEAIHKCLIKNIKRGYRHGGKKS